MNPINGLGLARIETGHGAAERGLDRALCYRFEWSLSDIGMTKSRSSPYGKSRKMPKRALSQ
jgi:hypothetical protein